MDTSKLRPGMEIKNYPTMCKLLGVPARKGNPRDRQQEDWKRYFSYSKEGRKFIIEEIYPEPKLKIDKRILGNNRKYSSYINILLADYVIKKSDWMRYQRPIPQQLTTKDIAIITGLCARRFYNNNYIKSLAVEHDIDSKQIEEFIDKIESKVYSAIEKSISQLKKRFEIVQADKKYIIVESAKKRMASTEEETIIKNTQESVNYSNADTTSFNRLRRMKFNKAVANELRKKRNWDIIYRILEIRFNGVICVNNKWLELSDNMTKEYRQILNNLMLESVYHFYENESIKLHADEREDFIKRHRLLASLLIGLDESDLLVYKDANSQ